MRFLISIGFTLGLLMLASGDYIGTSNYRGSANAAPNSNVYSHGFPSASNSNNNGFPSRDFVGNSDYGRNDYHGNSNSGPQSNYHAQGYPSGGNSNNGPNSNIYTHGFPSVGGNSLKGESSNGYSNQDSYGKTQYSRDPNADTQYNSRGNFGGSNYNHPSPAPPNGFRQQESFGNPHMANGYPQSSTILSAKFY